MAGALFSGWRGDPESSMTRVQLGKVSREPSAPVETAIEVGNRALLS